MSANTIAATLQVKPGVGGIVIAEMITQGAVAGQQNGQSNVQGSNPSGTAATNGSYMGAQPSSTQNGRPSSSFGTPGSSFGSPGSLANSSSSFGAGSQSSFSNNGSAGAFAGQQPGPFGAGQQLGGGAIIGVASTSTQQSIREFNGKDHYNDWAFIYDPRLDTRPLGAVGGGGIGQPIAPGQNGGAPIGQPSSNPSAPPTAPTAPTTTSPPASSGGQTPP